MLIYKQQEKFYISTGTWNSEKFKCVPVIFEIQIFQNLCKKGSIDFVPSRIGSYWLNDFNNDTEIDVMAIDNQNKRIFVGECKYHNKSVDAQVYFSLKENLRTLISLCFKM